MAFVAYASYLLGKLVCILSSFLETKKSRFTNLYEGQLFCEEVWTEEIQGIGFRALWWDWKKWYGCGRDAFTDAFEVGFFSLSRWEWPLDACIYQSSYWIIIASGLRRASDIMLGLCLGEIKVHSIHLGTITCLIPCQTGLAAYFTFLNLCLLLYVMSNVIFTSISLSHCLVGASFLRLTASSD